MSIQIGNHTIAQDSPPFIIAEMSGNHNGSLDRALQLVDAAASAGAHALKIQTYTADTMTLDLATDEFTISDPESPWSGTTLYKLYEQAHTPWEWHAPIFERATELGMLAFSSPFDATAVDFLESLNVPCYKIASFECIDIPLIRRVAQTGKPVIISTGMATRDEIHDAIATMRDAGNNQIIVLKCTSSYPAEPSDSNLRAIPDMMSSLNVAIGLSDHTLGIGAAVASVAFGVRVIEKHFTLSRNEGGVDAAFSLEPDELKQLVDETHRAWQSLGGVHYGVSEAEQSSLIFRRSLYICEDVKAGDVLNEGTVRSIRPGYGISPKYYDDVIGKRAARNLKRGTPLQRGDWH